METIENGDDESLLELGRHLDYEPDLSLLPDAVPSFWEAGHFRLFISHLAEYQAFASEIRDALLESGISSFVAHKDIKPTEEWQDVILSALTTCDGMLALLHDGFHESKWTDQEIGYGLGRKLLIVAVDLGTTPYGFIGKYQALPKARCIDVSKTSGRGTSTGFKNTSKNGRSESLGRHPAAS